MTGADDPPWSDTAVPSGDTGAGPVIPSPRGGCDGRSRVDDQWSVECEVRRVGGTDGMWLRRELASVIRELLVWAHQDRTRRVDDDPGEDQQTA